MKSIIWPIKAKNLNIILIAIIIQTIISKALWAISANKYPPLKGWFLFEPYKGLIPAYA